MNVKEYIASGVLEEYCLGLLTEDEQGLVRQVCKHYPAVKKELNAIESTMERLAAQTAVTPKANLREKILNSLGFPEPPIALDLNNLPATNAYANYRSWLKTVEHLIPTEPSNKLFVYPLRQDSAFAQMLVVSSTDIAEETHGDLKESFFILRGECECKIGRKKYTLRAGDFLEIPINKRHNVKILRPPVVAILQYAFVA